jgi:hypothetical protein
VVVAPPPLDFGLDDIATVAKRLPARLIVEIDIRQLLPGAVRHHKSRCPILRHSKAARSGERPKKLLF